MRRHKTAKRVSCGNAGAVESVESQRQASPSSHEPLGNLAKGGRDSHIPTAPAPTADGKLENQKQVFQFPTATIPLSKQKTQNRWRAAPPARHSASRLANQAPVAGSLPPFGHWTSTEPNQRKEKLRSTPISGSSRIGIEPLVQAHLPLESILDFRLICGLENA